MAATLARGATKEAALSSSVTVVASVTVLVEVAEVAVLVAVEVDVAVAVVVLVLVETGEAMAWPMKRAATVARIWNFMLFVFWLRPGLAGPRLIYRARFCLGRMHSALGRGAEDLFIRCAEFAIYRSSP